MTISDIVPYIYFWMMKNRGRFFCNIPESIESKEFDWLLQETQGENI